MRALRARRDAIERAQGCVRKAAAGAGGVLLFTGEPGIGKSSVLEHAGAAAAAEGARVAWGRCWEVGGAPAYWPWIQLFRELELSELFDANIQDLTGGAEAARFHAFDRVVRRLRAAAGSGPLVLVMDDLHAADVPSLLLLLLLAREIRTARVLVFGTYRDGEVPSDPACAALLAKLAREADVMPLARLPACEVRDWLRDVQPDTSDDEACSLYEMTEGLPLFIAEALRLGARTPAPAPSALRNGLQGLLDERLGALSGAAYAVLATAAVLGREFATAEVVSMGGFSIDEVDSGLREARDAGIVLPESGAKRHAFSHVLLRDRLYANLVPSARVSLNWRAGLAKLEGESGARAAVHHLLEGYRAGEPQRLIQVALVATAAALAQLAFEDAMRVAEATMRLVERDLVPGRLMGELRLAWAESAIRCGAGARGKDLAAEVARQAETANDPDLLASAALVYAIDLTTGEVDPPMVALLRQALARLPEEDAAVRARLTARLGAALAPPSSPEMAAEIEHLMRAAIGMARRLGDGRTLLYVLPFAVSAGMVAEPERLALLRETILLAEMLEQRLVLLATFPPYINVLLAVGKRADARAALASYADLVAESPQLQSQFRLRLMQTLVAYLDGDVASAARFGDEGRLLGQSAAGRAGAWMWTAHRLSLAVLVGDSRVIGDDVEQVIAVLGGSNSVGAFVAWILAGMGRNDEARARLLSAEVHPKNLFAVLGGAEACVALGERDLAPLYYEYLHAYADRMLWSLSPGSLLGPTARTLGDLALLCGHVPEALRHFDEAIDFCDRLEAPLLAAACRRRRAAAIGALAPARTTPAPQVARIATPGTRVIELVREGDVWRIRHREGPVFRLKHSKGLDYLQALLERPGQEIHVCELGGIEHAIGDAGPVLDGRAKDGYRARLERLRDDLLEAERLADRERASRARTEMDAIGEQLAGAVGLGGRDRRAASDSERARINVQRRVKDAIDRIAGSDPELGRYLSRTIRTGTFCGYTPV